MTKSTSIPKGKIRRSTVVGVAAAKVGAKKAVHFSKRPFLSEEGRCQADQKSDEEAARIIFDALCVLRGTALKAAQLIAMEIELLPPAYRNELAKACSQVPPMNRALVRKIVKNELGSPEKIFKSFDLIPFAAASLGQVHAATLEGGPPLSVKIQYPGIAEGVKSDIDLLKGILTPTRYHRIFADCFPAIERAVQEELDYKKEALNTAFFLEHGKADRFVIPRVFEQLSTGSVLTTSRISGCHLSQWLLTGPSQAKRDHFGQLLVDFLHSCAHEMRVIHADPNPGNYLFREDGRLGIIDFGCVAVLTPKLIVAMSNLMSPDRPINAAVEEQLHAAVGIHYREGVDPEAFATFLREWGEWLREPYAAEQYDFLKNADYFQRGHRFVKTFYQYIAHYDGDFIYFGRTLHGLMRMLQQIGARVKMTPLI